MMLKAKARVPMTKTFKEKKVVMTKNRNPQKRLRLQRRPLQRLKFTIPAARQMVRVTRRPTKLNPILHLRQTVQIVKKQQASRRERLSHTQKRATRLMDKPTTIGKRPAISTRSATSNLSITQVYTSPATSARQPTRP